MSRTAHLLLRVHLLHAIAAQAMPLPLSGRIPLPEPTREDCKPMTNVPETMRAVLLTGHGGPEMLEYREDIPTPAPAPGEVLVRVTACGINNTDIWVREGAYGSDHDPGAVSSWRRGRPLEFPIIQGADIAGRIAAVGDGVDEGIVGKRVMVDFGIYNDPGPSLANVDYIGHGRNGGFAEYCAVPAGSAHIVATPLSDAELATFCCAYVTAERMLARAHVTGGEIVLVTGASGGVGTGLVQLARARGAVPVAIASGRWADALLELGAQTVIARESDDLDAAIRSTLGARPVDVVADVVAGPLFKTLLNVLRPEGRYVTAGAIAGPLVELDLRTVYLKHLDLIGSTQGTREDFARVRDLAISGKIKPMLAGTYPLEDIARAQADFVAKDFIGKLVITTERAK